MGTQHETTLVMYVTNKSVILYADLLSLLTHYVTKIQLKELGSGCVGQGQGLYRQEGLRGWDTVITRQKTFYCFILFLFYGCQILERDKLHWLCH